MKGSSRARIMELILERGKMRPSELSAVLAISAQALHRHLLRLQEEGLLEKVGAPPRTYYQRAGVPDFEGIGDWVATEFLEKSPAEDKVCETRDALTGRLPCFKQYVVQGLEASLLPMVIAVSGELGNNSFDHNIGQWRDIPGCWFESQLRGAFLWVCIADRGQGIFRSLSRTHPDIGNEQMALEAAFERIISGRSPEQRGNGLKFVRDEIVGRPGAGLACLSGRARVSYGERGAECLEQLAKVCDKIEGTLTLLSWRIR